MELFSEEYYKHVEERKKDPDYRRYMIYGQLKNLLPTLIKDYGMLDVTYVFTKMLASDDKELRDYYEDVLKASNFK